MPLTAISSVEESLLLQLETYSDLVDLVSDRIYPQQRDPGEVLPCVTYALNDQRPLRNLDGPGGIQFTDIEITCWAGNHATAREVADLIIGDPESNVVGEARLQEFRGWMGVAPQRHWVQSSTVDEQNEDHSELTPSKQHARKRGTFFVTLKLSLCHNRRTNE